ncbi:MAG: phosphoribosyltransferase family protein [Capnocytophaga sp.]|nr:phosphoribosyltransferase family protein [Capnocytophaga sp.]
MSILFPKYCPGCGQVLTVGEQFLCTLCRNHLFETNFHQHPSNPIHKKLYGRCDLYCAASLLYFEKNTVTQQLIHELKYHHNEQIGQWLGAWLGAKLSAIPRFQKTEIVVPVPIHPQRLSKRGYNQVTLFGKELAAALTAEYCENILVKTTATASQTKKNAEQRWQSSKDIYRLNRSEKIRNRHVLLVDDLITSGATIEFCYNELCKADNTKVGVATMAFAMAI